MTAAEAIKELVAEVGQLRVELLELRQSRREKQEAHQGDGREHPDPTPIEIPLGFQAPPSLKEMVQEAVRTQFSAYAESQDLGTFEQEDDFEPEDEDLLILSGFEVTEYEMEDEAPLDDADEVPSSIEEPAKPGNEVTESPAAPAETEPAPPTA